MIKYEHVDKKWKIGNEDKKKERRGTKSNSRFPWIKKQMAPPHAPPTVPTAHFLSLSLVVFCPLLSFTLFSPSSMLFLSLTSFVSHRKAKSLHRNTVYTIQLYLYFLHFSLRFRFLLFAFPFHFFSFIFCTYFTRSSLCHILNLFVFLICKEMSLFSVFIADAFF